MLTKLYRYSMFQQVYKLGFGLFFSKNNPSNLIREENKKESIFEIKNSSEEVLLNIKPIDQIKINKNIFFANYQVDFFKGIFMS
jgi:hypothetical protein